MGMYGLVLAFDDDGFLTADVDEVLESSDQLSVEKAWHVLSVLLTPATDRLASIEDPHPLDPMLGGEPFGEDLGYGEPRYLTPDQVREVAAALAAVDDDALVARYDGAAFDAAGVYPGGFGGEMGAEEWLEEIVDRAAEVRAFYADAASRGRYVVLALS